MKTADDLAANVSRETLDRLRAFEALLIKWNPKINLVAPGEIPRLWERHILDSVQLFSHARPDFQTWTDMGSGGGFPGIVCAILATETNRDQGFTLIESDKRKSVFLGEAVRNLSLKATIRPIRIETYHGEKVDIVSARALASLDRLLELAHPMMDESTQLLFPKGKRVESELTAARRSWNMSVERIPSLTDPDGVILKLTGACPRNE